VILCGTIFSAFFANHEDTEWTVPALENVLLTYRTFWYIVIFFSWTFVNYVAAMGSPKGSYRRGLALGLMAGSLAGNMWCVKATMSLLAESISNGAGGVWDHWMPYATLVAAIFFAVSNVVFLTQATLECEAIFVVTIFEGSMLISNAASGCIVLQEMDNHPTWKVAMYAVCILVVFIGLCILVSGEGEHPADIIGSGEEEEEDDPTHKMTPHFAPKGILGLEVIRSGFGDKSIAELQNEISMRGSLLRESTQRSEKASPNRGGAEDDTTRGTELSDLDLNSQHTVHDLEAQDTGNTTFSGDTASPVSVSGVVLQEASGGAPQVAGIVPGR